MKVLHRFKKFTKKRQQQHQKKETEAKDITEHSSQESLQLSDDTIVNVINTEEVNSSKSQKCSNSKYCKKFKEFIQGYENDEGEFIDMSQPRDASYASKTTSLVGFGVEKVEKTKRLGEDLNLTSTSEYEESFDPYSFRSMPTEVRGITLRQLRAIVPLIKRRCKKEHWTRPVYKDGVETDDEEKVTLENATLYEVNKYIIKPFTEYSQKSFVETLPSTKGTQPPRWFVSHFWGESFVHTIACLEEMVKNFKSNGLNEEEYDENARGGGMTEDTPVWICAFANNQHDLQSEIKSNPADSAFAKAMSIANFRVISILDVNNQVYSRLWCMYELYLTLILSKKEGLDGLLAVYTYHEHEADHGIFGIKKIKKHSAVGLVDGGFKSQKYFPKERFFKSLSVSIQDAKASEKDDRKHILNALVDRKGNEMEKEPLNDHENYKILNNAVRGVFASTVGIKFAYDDGKKEHWNEALHAMKHSVSKKMKFDYLDGFKAEDVVDIFHHLPIGSEELEIIQCLHGRIAMDAFLDWLENTSTNLKKLTIQCTCIGGQLGGKECGERLARFLTRDDCKIEDIDLIYTDLVGSRNVETWIECLEKNKSLKNHVQFIGMVDNLQYVAESELPNTSVILHRYSFCHVTKYKVYWDGTTFPDGTLSKEQEDALKKTVVSKASIEEDKVHLWNFVLKAEESNAETEHEEATKETVSKAVDENLVLEECAAEKSTSNWLCGVASCM